MYFYYIVDQPLQNIKNFKSRLLGSITDGVGMEKSIPILIKNRLFFQENLFFDKSFHPSDGEIYETILCRDGMQSKLYYHRYDRK